MGYSRWSPSDWTSYSSETRSKSRSEIFRSHRMSEDLDPTKILMRESRDSQENPDSTALIVGLDVTGSMGSLAHNMATKGLGVLFQEVLDRKPVSDPHLMVMGIGDADYDSSPLQVSQFEADMTITKWLEKLYLESGGGGNDHESYTLPWYFAAKHTSIDCFEKRQKKGYIFTVGDERAPSVLTARQIQKVMGVQQAESYDSKDLLDLASQMYHVFHVVVEEGSYARRDINGVMRSWTDLLGQNVLRLSDHSKLSEVVVSAIEVMEGKDVHEVTNSWDGDTSLVVAHALSSIPKLSGSNEGFVKL